MTREQIGTVEITRLRIYPLDQVPHVVPESTMVAVEPGTYPVYRAGTSYYWRMTGVISHRDASTEEFGDGLFTLHVVDVRSDDDVVFYSKRYSPREWADLLASFKAETNPALVFAMNKEATS